MIREPDIDPLASWSGILAPFTNVSKHTLVFWKPRQITVAELRDRLRTES